MSKPITVATLNLLNDMRRWEARRNMIVDGFRHHKPDLIALQEVVLPLNTAEWLAGELGGYHVHLTPKTGPRLGQREGIAILSRLPVKHADWLDLETQSRVAQLSTVDAHGHALLFVNSHLHWYPGDSGARLQQVRLLQDWLHSHTRHHPRAGVIVCGDFNGTPGTRAIQQMLRGYHSAYALKHGREPHWTCPTPLQFATQPWRKMVMTLAGLATNGNREHWRGTLDYIFVNQHVKVHDAHVTFTHPATHDATLFASDHLGLVAEVTVG